jgi:hypothetical protein
MDPDATRIPIRSSITKKYGIDSVVDLDPD